MDVNNKENLTNLYKRYLCISADIYVYPKEEKKKVLSEIKNRIETLRNTGRNCTGTYKNETGNTGIRSNV